MSEEIEKTQVDTEEKPKKSTKKRSSSKKKKSSSKKSTTKKASAKSSKKKESDASKKEEALETSELRFSEKRHTTSSSNSKGVLVALGVALVIVIIAGGWYQTQQLNRSNQDATVNLDQKIETEVGSLKEKLQNLTAQLEEAKQEDEQEITELKQYTSPESGLSFMYPASLGDIEADIVDNDPSTPNDNIMRLTFSANPDIWINLTGSEYSASEDFIYNGATTDLLAECSTPLDVTPEGFCDLTIVASQDTVESVYPVGDTSLLNVVKTIKLNVPGQQFTGATFNLGYGLPPVTGRSLFAPTDEDRQEEALQLFYRNILKNEGLSLIVKENVTAFENLVDSIQIQP